jgi:hypothetical protein
MYAYKDWTIGGLCSPMLVEEPSVKDYLNWFSEEVTGLPSDSVDFDVVRVAASEGGVDVLPTGSSVRKVARAVSKKCWRSFGYDYVLSVIHAQQTEVLSCF